MYLSFTCADNARADQNAKRGGGKEHGGTYPERPETAHAGGGRCDVPGGSQDGHPVGEGRKAVLDPHPRRPPPLLGGGGQATSRAERRGLVLATGLEGHGPRATGP